MSDTTSTKGTTAAAPAKQSVNDECKTCGSLRGSAPEGIHDVASAFSHGVSAGDPKWTQEYCWKCGAKY